MTVKELASKMNELFREEKGDYIVVSTFKNDKSMTFQIDEVIEHRYESLNLNVIILCNRSE